MVSWARAARLRCLRRARPRHAVQGPERKPRGKSGAREPTRSRRFTRTFRVLYGLPAACSLIDSPPDRARRPEIGGRRRVEMLTTMIRSIVTALGMALLLLPADPVSAQQARCLAGKTSCIAHLPGLPHLVGRAGVGPRDAGPLCFVRELIALRRRHPGLRADGANPFHAHDDTRILAVHRWVEGVGRDVVVVAKSPRGHVVDPRGGLPASGPVAGALQQRRLRVVDEPARGGKRRTRMGRRAAAARPAAFGPYRHPGQLGARVRPRSRRLKRSAAARRPGPRGPSARRYEQCRRSSASCTALAEGDRPSTGRSPRDPPGPAEADATSAWPGSWRAAKWPVEGGGREKVDEHAC